MAGKLVTAVVLVLLAWGVVPAALANPSDVDRRDRGAAAEAALRALSSDGASSRQVPAPCSRSETVDLDDVDVLDIRSIEGIHICETDVLAFATWTFDDWADADLDSSFIHIDVDGNTGNGCAQGDYAIFTHFDGEALVAAVFSTPTCDDFAVVAPATADRVGSTDFLGVAFQRSDIGSPATISWYGVLLPTAGGFDSAPDVGVIGWPLPAPPAQGDPEPVETDVPVPPAEIAAGPPFDGDPATTERIDLVEPIRGAIDISRTRYEDGTAAYALLGRADGFVDSLSAAPLTSGGPLLLTPTEELPTAVAAELTRALPDGAPVYLLGGTAAVGEAVAEAVRALGFLPERLAGPDRIATAIAVAEEVVGRGGEGEAVALARAFGEGSAGWADSVTGGGWAADTMTPVLVTPTESLDPRVAEALQRLGATRTVLLGGTAALGAEVEAAVPGAQRVAGPDRAATAVAIAQQLWGPTEGFLVINGYHPDGWAYGLAGAGLAADHDMPLLVVDAATVPPATAAFAGAGCGVGSPQHESVLLGGPVLISEDVRIALEFQDGGVCPT